MGTQGVVIALLFIVGAQGIHWFLTPAAHADAGLVQHVAVAAQALLAFGFGYVMLRRARRQHG